MDVSEGNPFASMGAKLEESAGSKLKLPSLGGFNFSRDPDDGDEEELRRVRRRDCVVFGEAPEDEHGGAGRAGQETQEHDDEGEGVPAHAQGQVRDRGGVREQPRVTESVFL